jgi:hypothetical protein
MALLANHRVPSVGWRPLVVWLTGLLVAYLLLASSIAHLGNPYQFLAAIRAYQLIPTLPQTGAELVAIFLPFLHVTLAICLIGRVAQRSAFAVGFLMFLVYTIAQSSVYARGIKVGCGCFGPSEELIGVKSIGLAAASCAVCLFGWWMSRDREPLTSPQQATGAGP